MVKISFLFQNNIFLSAEFAEFGEKRLVQDAVGADALFFFFTVEDHASRSGEHGEQELNVPEEWMLLGGELDPEGLVRG